MSYVLDETNIHLAEFAAETMVYFEKHKLIEIAKKILVECSIERPTDAQQWIAENIKRIANEIYQDCLLNGKLGFVKNLHLSAHYLYRIVIYGRPGSGRHTQASYLSKAYNLVLIDAENLIYHHLRGDDDKPNDPLDRELQRAFYYDNCRAKGKALAAIIAKRFLHEDCLSRGWVLVNFPNTLEEFKELIEKSKIPPNKIVVLKCPQKISVCRLFERPKMNQPNGTSAYIMHEMRYFKQHEAEIDDYLASRHETIFVNAEPDSQTVRLEILSMIRKSPYVMGFRQNL